MSKVYCTCTYNIREREREKERKRDDKGALPQKQIASPGQPTTAKKGGVGILPENDPGD